jgi:dTDP-4-amino-4,6-dideoxygalactose transaminase
VAVKYKEKLKDFSNIKLPDEMPYAKHVYHLYVIQVGGDKKKTDSGKRDALQKYLGENGISTGLHYPIPLHVQPCFKDLNYKKGDFPSTEQLAETGLSLPMYPELKDEQIEYVCSKIREFLSK